MKLITILLVLSIICSPFTNSFAMTPEEEKRLIADVAEIKATLKTFMELTNKRFEDINKRFEDNNKRFEDINKRFDDINRRFEDINRRFEDINKRIDQLMKFMEWMLAIFTTLVVAVIGFAFWDRRTIIKKAKDEAIREIEREGKVKDLINALRKLSTEDQRLQEVLRSFGLL